MSRERIRPSDSQQPEETVDLDQGQEQQNASAIRDVHEVDDILDEIDELLAENAEEFVTGFVQKGGE